MERNELTKQERIDFAKQITAALTDGEPNSKDDWTVTYDDWANWMTLDGPDGVALSIHPDPYPHRGQASIGVDVPNDLSKYTGAYGLPDRPSIHVSRSRSFAAIARDIRHRAIPQAAEYLAALRAKKAQDDDYNAQRLDLIAAIGEALGKPVTPVQHLKDRWYIPMVGETSIRNEDIRRDSATLTISAPRETLLAICRAIKATGGK